MNHKSIWSCDTPPGTIVKAGSELLMPYVWGYHDETGKPAPPKDILITIDRDLTISDALCVVEEKCLEYVISTGASEIRQYYIEDVIHVGDRLEFVWGT